MHVQALGHVVLKVRDLERSEDFYANTLGMQIISRLSEPHMTFFSLGTTGNHHDFALIEIGFGTPSPDDTTIGLAHVAFKIGTCAEELHVARSTLRDAEVPILYEAERGFATSLHVLDPDRNEIELYVDTSGE